MFKARNLQPCSHRVFGTATRSGGELTKIAKNERKLWSLHRFAWLYRVFAFQYFSIYALFTFFSFIEVFLSLL